MKALKLSLLASIVLAGGLYADITSGLVAHYKLNGDAKDSSGNGNNGTTTGSVTYEDGVIGRAAKFANGRVK